MTKVPDKAFWEILASTGGIYNRAARIIRKKYNEPTYSRTTVKERAEKQPERLASILDATIDDAEGVLGDLMFASENEKTKLEAVKFYLKTKGKSRGYTERSEVTGTNGRDLVPSLQVEVIDRREQVRHDDTND